MIKPPYPYVKGNIKIDAKEKKNAPKPHTPGIDTPNPQYPMAINDTPIPETRLTTISLDKVVLLRISHVNIERKTKGTTVKK